MFDRLLLWSVKKQYPFLVKFALWIGANPNIKDDDGNSLLHILIDSKDQKRAKEIADILFKNNLNISATNKDEETALEYASSKSNSVMLSFLLGQNPTRRLVINTFIYKYHRHKALRPDTLKDKLIKLAFLRRTNPIFSEEDKNTVSNICTTLKNSYQNQDDKKTLKSFIQYMNEILPILEAPKGEKFEASKCPMLSIINGILNNSNYKNTPTISRQQTKVSHSKQLRINTSDSNTSSKNNSPSNSPKQSQRLISNTISPSSTTSSSSWSSRSSSRESSPSSSRGK